VANEKLIGFAIILESCRRISFRADEVLGDIERRCRCTACEWAS
jgi:hypothetical protein